MAGQLLRVSLYNSCNVVTDRKGRLPDITRRGCHTLVFVELLPRKEVSTKHILLSGKRAEGYKDLPPIRVYRASEQVLDLKRVVIFLTRNAGRKVKAAITSEVEQAGVQQC